MVALVILGLVVPGFLDVFARSLRAAADARTWAQALVFAEQGQEMIKIQGAEQAARSPAPGGGFGRRILVRPWRAGLERATVTVTLPDGARFDLDRLVPAP